MTEGARRAYKVRNTFRLRTNKASLEIPLERGNDYLFLCLKEKGRKRSRQPCRLIACAPINCVAMAFSAPIGTVPQMAVSSTPKAKRLESLGSRNSGFDLMGAVRIHLHHANLTVRGSFDRMDAGVRRRGFTAPTWGFFPTVCRRTNSDSFSPSADGTEF